MRQYKSYKCNICKSEIEVQTVGKGTLSCSEELMTLITSSLTAVNLMKAFAGKSMARNKYEFFAEIDKEEGLHDVARLLKAIVKVEIEHEHQELKSHLEDEVFFESNEDEFWVCEVCGHVHRGKKAPKENDVYAISLMFSYISMLVAIAIR